MASKDEKVLSTEATTPPQISRSNEKNNMTTHRMPPVDTKQQDYHIQPGHYRNVREYAQALQPWLYQYQIMTTMNMFYSSFPYLLMPPALPGTFQAQPSSSSLPDIRMQNNLLRQPTQSGENLQGTVYWVPSLLKRMVAELLDFVVLFYIKLLVSVMVLKQLGYMDNSMLFISMDIPTFLDVSEMDYDKAFALTSELIALEVVNRICITIVETLCLRHGYAGSIGGATPGKRMMGMKVVSCTDVIEQESGQILVIPAQNIGLASALVRSAIKNFTIAFFFPACLSVFFFNNNRAVYDIIAGTVVVQTDNRGHQ